MPPVPRLQRLAGAVTLALLVGGSAWAQADLAAPPPPGKDTPPSVSGRTQPRATPRTVSAPRPESQPTWEQLAPAQQQSLAPLAGSWRSLSAGHKRKWIALSANYAALPPPEQARLHSRMAEWAALSPQQRTQARLNFADTQALPDTDKKAKWEAYQALPPEEKRKLAAGAAAKPAAPATAAAAQPVPQQKLVRIPRPKKADNPRTAAAPGRVDANTLLPRPAPPAAPAAPAAPIVPPPPAPAAAPAPLPAPAPVLP